MADLMEILTDETGLSPELAVSDRSATLEDLGLDSLAFLQLQAVVDERYGFELDESTQSESFGVILDSINQELTAKATLA